MSPYFVISQKSGKKFFLSIYNESVFKLKLGRWLDDDDEQDDEDDDDEQDNEDNLV